MMEVQTALKEFLREIEILIEEYGEDPVAAALEQLLTGFQFLDEPLAARIDSAQERHRSSGVHQEEGEEAMFEGKVRRAKRLLDKTKEYITGKMSRGAGTTAKVGTGAGAGAAGGRMLGGASLGLGAFVGKTWDQDVSIDDITTDKALNVRAEELEDLLTRNYQAIEKMTQVITQTQQELSKKLGDIDKSVDYLSTDEDETPETVDVRQDLGLSRVGFKKDKKEKKAKEIEQNRKQGAPTAV